MKDFKFKIGSQNYTATVSEEEDGNLNVVLNGKTYHVEVPARKAAPRPVVKPSTGASAPAASKAPAAAPVTGAITAQLPGTIKQVLVKEGQAVKRGETILTLEAMKMENSVPAEADGIVGKVHVAPGQSVNLGDVLIEFQGVAAPEAPTPAAPRGGANTAAAPAPAAVPVGANTITAPLPGTVKSIKVKVGDTVAAGDTVLTLEAMKMESSIPAEAAGTVKNILVTEGAQVQSGQVLVELG